ncbi:unnamed protein product [Choristocarpus tenellus]
MNTRPYVRPRSRISGHHRPTDTRVHDSSMHHERTLSSVEVQIENLILWLQPSRQAEERRQAVFDHVRTIVREQIPSCEVFPVGSFPLKSYLPCSDVDMVMFIPTSGSDGEGSSSERGGEALGRTEMPWACTTDRSDGLLEVNQALCRASLQRGMDRGDSNMGRIHGAEGSPGDQRGLEIRNVSFVNARTPMVTMRVGNIVVDLTENQLGSIAAAALLEEADKLIRHGHLFKRSILLLKTWMLCEAPRLVGQRVFGGKDSGLTSYALSILVLLLFQSAEVAKTLQHPVDVLLRFFRVYSTVDWERTCFTFSGPLSMDESGHMSSSNRTRSRKSRLWRLVNRVRAQACHGEKIVKGWRGRGPYDEDGESKSKKCLRRDSCDEVKFPLRFCNVQDPLNPLNNLGHSVSHRTLKALQCALSKGRHHLEYIVAGCAMPIAQSSPVTEQTVQISEDGLLATGRGAQTDESHGGGNDDVVAHQAGRGGFPVYGYWSSAGWLDDGQAEVIGAKPITSLLPMVPMEMMNPFPPHPTTHQQMPMHHGIVMNTLCLSAVKPLLLAQDPDWLHPHQTLQVPYMFHPHGAPHILFPMLDHQQVLTYPPPVDPTHGWGTWEIEESQWQGGEWGQTTYSRVGVGVPQHEDTELDEHGNGQEDEPIDERTEEIVNEVMTDGGVGGQEHKEEKKEKVPISLPEHQGGEGDDKQSLSTSTISVTESWDDCKKDHPNHSARKEACEEVPHLGRDDERKSGSPPTEWVKNEGGSGGEWFLHAFFPETFRRWTSGDGFREDLLDHPCQQWSMLQSTTRQDNYFLKGRGNKLYSALHCAMTISGRTEVAEDRLQEPSLHPENSEGEQSFEEGCVLAGPSRGKGSLDGNAMGKIGESMGQNQGPTQVEGVGEGMGTDRGKARLATEGLEASQSDAGALLEGCESSLAAPDGEVVPLALEVCSAGEIASQACGTGTMPKPVSTLVQTCSVTTGPPTLFGSEGQLAWPPLSSSGGHVKGGRPRACEVGSIGSECRCIGPGGTVSPGQYQQASGMGQGRLHLAWVNNRGRMATTEPGSTLLNAQQCQHQKVVGQSSILSSVGDSGLEVPPVQPSSSVDLEISINSTTQVWNGGSWEDCFPVAVQSVQSSSVVEQNMEALPPSGGVKSTELMADAAPVDEVVAASMPIEVVQFHQSEDLNRHAPTKAAGATSRNRVVEVGGDGKNIVLVSSKASVIVEEWGVMAHVDVPECEPKGDELNVISLQERGVPEDLAVSKATSWTPDDPALCKGRSAIGLEGVGNDSVDVMNNKECKVVCIPLGGATAWGVISAGDTIGNKNKKARDQGNTVLSTRLLQNVGEEELSPALSWVTRGDALSMGNDSASLDGDGLSLGSCFQWMKDGAIIPGAIRSRYSISNVSLKDEGTYTCHITTIGKETNETSLWAEALLRISEPPVVESQSLMQRVILGETLAISFTAKGIPQPKYQWCRDGVPIPGATEQTFLCYRATESDMGTYTCDVSNVAGWARWEKMSVVMQDRPGMPHSKAHAQGP